MRTPPEPSPDGLLLTALRRAQTGDPEAEEMLLATLHAPILNYVKGYTRRMPDDGDVADDVAQETLIRMATRLRSCRAESDDQVLGWALAIARTRLADYLRRIPPAVERMTDDVAGPTYSPTDTSGAGTALRGLVRRVVRSLPRETRVLLELRVERGESWAEVAQALRTTAAGAKRRFQRAQARLQRELEGSADRLPVSQREEVHAQLKRLK
jgi:RNA polymerase sigma-70 factor (ECF subfamily)